jgi:4-hydroxy 2-oxovalerate aldolase
MTRVRVTDVTLRDGSHAMEHRFTLAEVTATVAALERAGAEVIEVAHGDGLGGSSFNYGFSATDELELVRAACETADRARIACLLLPGVGTVAEIDAAADAGAHIIRVGTHCTEADIAIQHLAHARERDLETVGFLMLSHMAPPRELAQQARIMVDAGAMCVYVVDSAGALLPAGAVERVRALLDEIGDDAQVGFHAHNNLGVGVANSLAAAEAGARQIDGALASLGAGAGNAATEVLAAAFERAGIDTGLDVIAALQAAQDVVRPYIRHEPKTDFASVILGYAGVYSSFLLHAQRAADRYGVPMHEILLQAGRRQLVGGQEDVMIEIAVELAGATAA